jgi:hypothetical protein
VVLSSRRMSAGRARRVAIGGAFLLAAFALIGLAWGVDKMLYAGRVSRNVTLAGRPIGGMDTGQLEAVVEDLIRATSDTALTVSADGFTISATNAEAGVTIDRDAVVAASFDVGRSGNPLAAFCSWIRSFWDPIEVQPSYAINAAVAAEMVRSAPGAVRVAPVEPSFTAANGKMVVTPGREGMWLDPVFVADALAAEVAFGRPPFSVDVEWSPMQPRFDDRDVAAALEMADELSDRALTVRINGNTATVGTTTLFHWIDSKATADGLVAVFNEERANRSLELLLDGFATDLPQPVFSVAGDVVSFTLDGAEAETCCSPSAAELMYDEARHGGNTMVLLPTRPVETDGGVGRVENLGITELVSEFTTNHACCQRRVENIHRIADLIRGVVIKPGERFSVNDFVGRRTREKGFVAAGTIQQGHYKDDVGGGISQFATTMFNAAFFAGLELDDYKAHSIYISRYPYGREATLNYPDVDLAVINNTPYGILIWTEYTETSITVQMYSTHYWDVEQTGQSSWRSGACTAVETFRSRTNTEGVVVEDSVNALYRPGEGLDCRGRATPRP